MRRAQRRSVTLLVGAALTLGVVSATLPTAGAATNDTPQTAAVIGPGTGSVDVVGGTTLSSPVSACYLNRATAWFRVTPDHDFDLSLTAVGAKAVDVYTGTANSLTRLYCNDDNGPFGATSDNRTRLTFAVEGGTTYYLALNTGAADGRLLLDEATYTAPAADVDYQTKSGTKTVHVGGVIASAPLHVDDQDRQAVLFRRAQFAVAQDARLSLVRGDRRCPQQMSVGDELVFNADGEWGTSDALLVPTAEHGDSCDPDGQMDGGSYDIRYAVRAGAGQPWSEADIGAVHVTGPNGDLRVISTEAERHTVVDYPNLTDTVDLRGAVEEQWTDGSWRPVLAGTVARSDLRIEVSSDGGASWTTRALPSGSDDYLPRSTVPVRIEPHQDGLFRLAAPGQSPSSTSDEIDVIAPTGRFDVDPLDSWGRAKWVHQGVVVESQARVLFDDGVWRPNKGATFRLEYRKKGTDTWSLIKTGNVRDDGDISVRFNLRVTGAYRVTVDGHSSKSVTVETRIAPPSQVFVDAPFTIRAGDPFTVRGCLANRYDDCFAGKKLVVQYSSGGSWVTLDSGVTGDDGWVSLRVPSARVGTYRIYSPTTGISKWFTYVEA